MRCSRVCWWCLTMVTATIAGRTAWCDEPVPADRSVVQATMATLHEESLAIRAVDDPVARELAEAQRTWRAIAIELLRIAGAQRWTAQSAFVSGMRMAHARTALDARIGAALALPRDDARVTQLAKAARPFNEHAAALLHGADPTAGATLDDALRRVFGALPDALLAFDDEAPVRADLWPPVEGRGPSTDAVETLKSALDSVAIAPADRARALVGVGQLRKAAAIAAFRPEVEAIAADGVSALRLAQRLGAVGWAEPSTLASIQTSAGAALARLDTPADRAEVRVQLARLTQAARMVDALDRLMRVQAGRPWLGADRAADILRDSFESAFLSERAEAAEALARLSPSGVATMPPALTKPLAALLRAAVPDRDAVAAWLESPGETPVPTALLARLSSAATDITLVAGCSQWSELLKREDRRALKGALTLATRHAESLRSERAAAQARDALIRLDARIRAWVALPGEAQLGKDQSKIAALLADSGAGLNPASTRAALAATILRARSAWMQELARGRDSAEHAPAIETLARLMSMIERVASLGATDDSVMDMSRRLASWAAWCPGAMGVATTVAPLRPRLLLAAAEANAGQWRACHDQLDRMGRDLALAELVCVVGAQLGPALPAQAPSIGCIAASIASPVHPYSWLSDDRSALATIARAWAEWQHARDRQHDADAVACDALVNTRAAELLRALGAVDQGMLADPQKAVAP